MSLNGNGVGFQFFSKDSGLGKYIKKITTGFGKFKHSFDDAADDTLDKSPRITEGIGLIEKALGKLDAILAQNKLQTWIASFSLARLHDISEGIQNIAEGMNLSTGLEDTMVANAKATKALGENFGYTGAAAQKFSSQASSLAYGMNVSTENASKATYAMDTWGKALRAVGIDSKQTAIKVQEVFGVDINEFGNQLTTLQKEFKFTDKELNNVVGGMQHYGQQIGDVKGALAQLPKTIEMIRKRSHALGKTLDSSTLADYAAQQQEVAAGFYALTSDSKVAQDAAEKITEALINSDKNLGEMFAGTSEDLLAQTQSLGIAVGDIDKTFAMMQKGPAGFVKALAGMTAQMGGTAKMSAQQSNFIHQNLEKALGPEAAQQVWNFFENADEATLKTMASVKGATADLGKLGKEGFSTGLTLKDSFERAKDAFIMNFRAISRKEAVNFVAETSAEFKKFSKGLTEVAADGGPMGAIVSKFSEMHQIGALALLPKTLRPMATVFGSMLKEATPLIGALGALGLNFKHLTVVTPILAVLGLAAAMKAAEKKTMGQVDALAASASESKKLSVVIATLTKERDKQTVGTEAWNKINKQIVQKQWLLKEAAQMKAAGKDAAKQAAVRTEIAEHEKQRSITQITEGTKAVLEKIKLFAMALPQILSGAFSALKEMWPVLGPMFYDGLSAAFRWTVDHAFPAIVDFVNGMWDGVINGNAAESGSAAQRLGTSFGNTLHVAFDYAITYIGDYLVAWWGKMGSIWSDGSLSLTDKIKATFSNSLGLILGIFAIGKFTPIFGILKTMVPLVLNVGKAFFNIAKEALPMAFNGIKMFASAAFSLGKTLVVDVIPAILKTVWAVGVELAKATWNIATTVLPRLIAGFASAGLAMIQFALQAARMGITMILTNPILAAVAAVAALVTYLVVKSKPAQTATEEMGNNFKALGTAGEEAWVKVQKAMIANEAAQKAMALAQQVAKDAINSTATEAARSVTGTMVTVRREGKTAFVEVSNAADLAAASTKKASDQLAKELGANIELVDKQVRIINKMAPPKFDRTNDDAALKLMSEYDTLAKSASNAMKNSTGGVMDKDDVELVEKAQDRQTEIIEEMQKTYGLNVSAVKDMIRFQQEQFSSKKDLIATMGVTEQKAYQSQLDMAFESYRVQVGQLAKLRQAGQITSDEYDRQVSVLKQSTQEAKSQIEVITGQVQANWAVALYNAANDAQTLMATAGQVASKLESETTQAIGYVSAQLADSAQAAKGALTSAFLAQTNEIAKMTGIDATKRRELLAQVEADYATQQKELIRRAQEAQTLINNNAEGNKEAALKMLDDFTDRAKKMTEEKVGATNAAVGSFQAQMGVSNEEALRSLEAISKIDPKVFAANLEQIKTTYVAFAQSAIEQSKIMIDSTGRALDDLSLKLIDFWQRQKETMVTVGGLNEADLAMITANITAAVVTVTSSFFGTFGKVLGEGFNIVLETSFTKAFERTKKFLADELLLFKNFVKSIGKEFENAWTGAMSSTAKIAKAVQDDLASTVNKLRGLTSAIEAHDSQERALRNESRIKTQDIRKLSEGERDQELLAATNWPAWYDDYSAKFTVMLGMMSTMSNGSGAKGGRVTSNSTTNNRGAAPTGMGR